MDWDCWCPLDFLILDTKEKVVDFKSITIVTPYKGQLKLYVKARGNAVLQGLVNSIDDLPQVILSTDASPSRENDNIIHGWVASEAWSKSDMGFTLDN